MPFDLPAASGIAAPFASDWTSAPAAVAAPLTIGTTIPGPL
jgi:hypothetical protein